MQINFAKIISDFVGEVRGTNKLTFWELYVIRPNSPRDRPCDRTCFRTLDKAIEAFDQYVENNDKASVSLTETTYNHTPGRDLYKELASFCNGEVSYKTPTIEHAIEAFRAEKGELENSVRI